MDTTVYDRTIRFGIPGQLVTLPYPRNGVEATRIRPVDVFQLDSGGVRVGKLVGGKRRYQLRWENLDYEMFTRALAYEQGHCGTGPFVLLDPGQRNLLTVNQSGATGETYDTTGFSVAGSGGSLASTTAVYRRGPRSLSWIFAYSTPTSGTVTLSTPSSEWTGIPVVSGGSYVFAVQAKGGGSDAVVGLTARITWYDAAGATVATSAGSNATTSSSAWVQPYVVAVAPTTAVYALPSVSANGSTVTSGSVVYLDEFQLELGAGPTAWRPGTGVLPVSVVSLAPDTHSNWMPAIRVDRPVLVLQEVGA